MKKALIIALLTAQSCAPVLIAVDDEQNYWRVKKHDAKLKLKQKDTVIVRFSTLNENKPVIVDKYNGVILKNYDFMKGKMQHFNYYKLMTIN